MWEEPGVRALVLRSFEEARRSAEFISAFESILTERRAAYEELAKGPDQQTTRWLSDGK